MKPTFQTCCLAILTLASGWFANPAGFAQEIVPSRPSSRPANSDRNASRSDRPKWDEIEKTIQSTLAAEKGYRPGDLITRDDGSRVFAALKKIGWEVKGPGELAERMLSSSDELVRELRSKDGRKFMRNITSVPGGYDRLDRLRNLPQGSRRLREFITQPEGHKLIEYMATTPGGKKMGRELSSKKRGNFNAPTQKIYTEQELIAELKTQYDAPSEPKPEASEPARRR